MVLRRINEYFIKTAGQILAVFYCLKLVQPPARICYKIVVGGGEDD